MLVAWLYGWKWRLLVSQVDWNISAIRFMVPRRWKTLVIPRFLLECHWEVDFCDFVWNVWTTAGWTVIKFQTFMVPSGWIQFFGDPSYFPSTAIIRSTKLIIPAKHHQHCEHVVMLVQPFCSKPLLCTAICYTTKKIKAAKIQYHPWVKLYYYKKIYWHFLCIVHSLYCWEKSSPCHANIILSFSVFFSLCLLILNKHTHTLNWSWITKLSTLFLCVSSVSVSFCEIPAFL